jgi:hypothetical protein
VIASRNPDIFLAHSWTIHRQWLDFIDNKDIWTRCGIVYSTHEECKSFKQTNDGASRLSDSTDKFLRGNWNGIRDRVFFNSKCSSVKFPSLKWTILSHQEWSQASPRTSRAVLKLG